MSRRWDFPGSLTAPGMCRRCTEFALHIETTKQAHIASTYRVLKNSTDAPHAQQAMEGVAADGAPNPSKMTIAEIKGWLMDAGQEGKVWELTQGKAKKADWVALMRSVL